MDRNEPGVESVDFILESNNFVGVLQGENRKNESECVCISSPIFNPCNPYNV